MIQLKVERINLLSNLISHNFLHAQSYSRNCWCKMVLIIWEKFKRISLCSISRIVNYSSFDSKYNMIYILRVEYFYCKKKRDSPKVSEQKFLWSDRSLSPPRLNKIKLWDSSQHVTPWRRTKDYYWLSDSLVFFTQFALEISPDIIAYLTHTRYILSLSNYILLQLLGVF